MANIAQMVNVLQAMILTNDKGLLLTPTYHVFNLYKVHQNATYLPLDIESEKKNVRDNRIIPLISATASKDKNGVIHVSLSNVDADSAKEVAIELPEINNKQIKGEILTSANLNDHNTFENPDKVKIVSFRNFEKTRNGFTVKLPAKSIVNFSIE